MNHFKSYLKYVYAGLAIGFLNLSFYTSVSAQVPAIERDALVALYNATDGPNWTNSTNWNTANPVSTWYGVTVVANTVTNIILESNQLNGTLPTELGDLSNLEILNLQRNQLNGTIPAEIGNLSILDNLGLSYNQLSGNIPPELGNLSNLRLFYGRNNQLSGTIPPELGNLSTLTYIELNQNQLSGSIPPELGNLLNLGSLNLSSNMLTGSIPAELGLLSNLTSLYLQLNQLSGVIPPELGDLTNLIYFDIGSNSISGAIPPELGNLSNLSEFYAYSNQLTSIPPEIGNLSSLTRLNIGDNQLVGTIPAELGNLSNLIVLQLAQNQLSGSIPPELGNLSNLVAFRISDNQISGPIPPELGNLTSLTDIAFQNNLLSGSIPPELGNWTNIIIVYLFNNQLSGSIPPELGNMTNLRDLYLWTNQLSGTIPPELSNLSNLGQLQLYDNQLTGTIPVELGNLSSINLTAIGLNNNQLTGPIPSELGNLSALQSLQLQDNQLSGTIPVELTNLSNLYGLLISNNQFNNLPDLSGLATLGVVWFEGNYFEFDDLEPNAGITGIIYSPQQNVPAPPQQDIALGQPLDITIAVAGSANQYQWYLDGVAVSGATTDNLQIASLSGVDAGNYHLEVTSALVPGLTISSDPFLVNVTGLTNGVLDQDYNALVALYNDLDGPNWTNNSNWISANPVSTWNGITVTGDRVTGIDLSSNNLSGTIPIDAADLTELNSLILSDNQLQDLPDLTALVNLTDFQIQTNAFGFDDLEPNAGITGINYSPQQNVPAPPQQDIAVGLPLDITIAVAGSSNQYQWYLDGVAVSGATTDNLLIASVSLADAGTYHLEVTNTLVPGLTISSDPFLVNVTGGTNGVLDQDYNALVALYNATDGPNWTNNTNWLSANPVDTWYGVTVVGGRVTQIELSNNQLNGTLPSELGDVSNLAILRLTFNSVSGPLPAELGNLSNLLILEMYSNQLSGTIPPELGNLLNLTDLALGLNQFSGAIPVELGNMSSLDFLGLGANQLTGSIPAEIGNISTLRRIYLFENQLSGSIPPELGNLSNLTDLLIWDNQLSGAVPTELGNLINLVQLVMNDNQLQDLPDLTTLVNLGPFQIRSNALGFDDIEPNVGIAGIQYSPQSNVAAPAQQDITVGQPLDITIAVGGSANQYQWYLDGVAVSGATTDNLLIPSISLANAGTYHLEVTNTLVPGLTISSDPFLVNVTGLTNGVFDQDYNALVALYNNLNGPNWTNNTNWLSANPVDTWYGITVAGGRVTQINLSSNQLSGSLPTEFGDLTGLTDVTFFLNQLSGSIPAEFGNLSSLVNLDMSQNQLTGSIPAELGNLSNLNTLFLNNNQLSGSIPPELGNLSTISLIHLGFNLTLSGPIPPELGNLTTLTELYLFSNQLSGTIPVELGNLSNLTVFQSHVNQLSGSIPIELGNLTNLNTINLDDNQLSGSIPTEFGNLLNLSSIFLANNQLNGSVPAGLSGLSNLTTISIQNNLLQDLPDLSGLTNLISFQLNNNFFEFDDLEANVGISGISYSPQGRFTGVAQQDLLTGDDLNITIPVAGSANQYQWYKDGAVISGATSDNLLISNVSQADAGNYYLEATNTTVTGLTLRSEDIVVTVGLRGGVLEEDYLALEALYNATDGANWTNNTNWLSAAPVTDWFGVNSSNERVTEIILENNMLVGTLPSQLSSLEGLITLNLQNNQIDGTLLSELENLSSLNSLSLGGNIFSGSIPIELGNLSSLRELVLNSNQLSGSIPSELGNLSTLEVLDLSFNQLEGPLSNSLGNLTGLRILDLSYNDLSDSLPSAIGNMVALEQVILSNNRFTGRIPDEILNWVNIQLLDLSSNFFSGIPDLSSFGSLTNFRITDNKLTYTDMLPNVNLITENTFQKAIGDTLFINAFTFSELRIDPKLDKVPDQGYQWYKDLSPIPGATSHYYDIDLSLDPDAGTYYVQFTHPSFPNITLERSPIILSLGEGDPPRPEFVRVLSPDGDGVNDAVVIKNIQYYINHRVLIYDVLGRLVFSTTNYDNINNSFQGRGNVNGYGELENGTYYYLVDVGDPKKNGTGFFVMKR